MKEDRGLHLEHFLCMEIVEYVEDEKGLLLCTDGTLYNINSMIRDYRIKVIMIDILSFVDCYYYYY
jgi:hypothetical protein